MMKDDLIYLVDYYIENGFYVFTEAYHRKRGYCCGSQCRHCPYPGSAGKEKIDTLSKNEEDDKEK